MNHLKTHTKPFFPFYQRNKENTAPTEALYLPIAQQQLPPQALLLTAGCRAMHSPKPWNLALFQLLPSTDTMNLQPHGSFAEVINTFRESRVSSLDSVERQFCPLLCPPTLVFCVRVCLFVVNRVFFPSLFLGFAIVYKTPPCKGEQDTARRKDGNSWITTYVQFHSSSS